MENTPQIIDQSKEIMIDPWKKLEVVKKCFAPQLTHEEFSMFLGLGRTLGANPFTREIWAVKYGTGAAQIFCGRDFYRRKAQEQSDYNGHLVNSVYENDGFSIKNGQPEHIVNSFKDRGNLVGAFCAVYKKGQQVPYFVTVRLEEYDKHQSNWKTMPDTMIKKVAEAQALRGAYQGIFRGTYDESENFTGQENAPEKMQMTTLRDELSKLITECHDEDLKALIIDEIGEAEATESLTIEKFEAWIALCKKQA